MKASKEREEKNQAWYAALKKPKFAPSAKLFGFVWGFLYFVIGVSALYVIRKIFVGAVPVRVLLPLALNVLFNLLYTPIQFRLKKNWLAFADVLLVIGTLGWLFLAIGKYYPVIVYANVPYLLWSLFAAILQGDIAWLNRKPNPTEPRE